MRFAAKRLSVLSPDSAYKLILPSVNETGMGLLFWFEVRFIASRLVPRDAVYGSDMARITDPVIEPLGAHKDSRPYRPSRDIAR
jgi:hypothetical protein